MKLKVLIRLLFLVLVVSACGEKKEGYTLNGNIKGIKDGKVTFINYSDKKSKPVTKEVKDGKFTFTGSVKEPILAILKFNNNSEFTKSLYLENSKVLVEGDIKKLRDAKVTGSKTQAESDEYMRNVNRLLNSDSTYRRRYYRKGLTKEEKIKYGKQKDSARSAADRLTNEYQLKYIKEHPNSYFTPNVVASMMNGIKAEEAKKILNSLSPFLKKRPKIIELNKKIDHLLEYEVDVADLMKSVDNVEYSVNTTFKGDDHKKIDYLAIFKNNNICALSNRREISVIDKSGKLINKFKPTLKGKAYSIAVDESDKIYVFSSIIKEIEKKVRGRKVKKRVSKGIECTIYNTKGDLVSTLHLKNINYASGAKIVENDIILSDCSKSKILFYDRKTGKQTNEIKGMRPCCGILDISVSKDKNIIVANLGAFRVQSYDFNGKNNLLFGKKSRDINDFHGCCNPVTASFLSNGAIVTVEKDPTRIKVYSKEGAKKIRGIDELVKGCSFIPTIVDSHDNIYLASPKKGLIKCSTIKKRLATL